MKFSFLRLSCWPKECIFILQNVEQEALKQFLLGITIQAPMFRVFIWGTPTPIDSLPDSGQ